MRLIALPVLIVVALSGCNSAPQGFTSSTAAPAPAATGDGAPATEVSAQPAVQDTPDTRVLQVAYASARADKCAFFYDLPKLKANYLASETAAGATVEQIARLDKAFEFTRGSVTNRIATNAKYCENEGNLKEIRGDLNRYLAGDFSARAVKKASSLE